MKHQITEYALGFYTWLRLHPIKAWIFSWLFGAYSAAIALVEHPAYWTGGFLVLLVIFALNIWRDSRIDNEAIRRALRMKNVISSALVIAALLLSGIDTKAATPEPVQPPQQAGIVGVGVVVIVVGGVFTYGLIKLCKRLSPPPPPAPTNITFQATGSTGDDYAASYVYLTGSVCYSPSDLRAFQQAGSEPTPYMTRLTAKLEDDGQGPQMKISKVEQLREEGSVINLEDYEQAIAVHGIRLNTYNTERTSFGLNGRPASADQVPVSFDRRDNSVTIGRGETIKVVIEKSDNLTDWEPVVVTSVPLGQRIQITDIAVTTQMFYRTRTL